VSASEGIVVIPEAFEETAEDVIVFASFGVLFPSVVYRDWQCKDLEQDQTRIHREKPSFYSLFVVLLVL